ncbi:MAG: OmpA family protein [Rhizobacter sp.]|nr:OmpA family protein [Rhizobacter sp.]
MPSGWKTGSAPTTDCASCPTTCATRRCRWLRRSTCSAKPFWGNDRMTMPSWKRICLPLVLAAAGLPAWSQAAGGAPQQVVVAGTVPDEATRNAILARVREVYGAERVVDQLGVGAVVAPPHWSGYVQKLVSPQLKQVSRGQLVIDGNNIELKGEVANESQRQQLAADMATVLNPTYAVRNALRVAAQEQTLLDATLANRIIEFEAGSSVLRPAGRTILDEMAATLLRMGSRKLEVIGHTDSQGARETNIVLSLARADAVRSYLAAKGVSPSLISTSGSGPDRPVAPNDTAEGRARNRRIEFRVSQ